jgi:hypothetical protein
MHGIADNVPSRKSASESQLPVFQQEWWRSVVARTPGYRENTVVREKQVVGTLPYLLKSRLGVRVGAIPWSNLTGPIIADARLSEVDRIRVVDELVKGIPPHVSMRYMFDSDDPNASLYVSIFEKAHFAFEIERNFREPPDASDVFKRVVRRHKNPINQAMKHLDIVESRMARSRASGGHIDRHGFAFGGPQERTNSHSSCPLEERQRRWRVCLPCSSGDRGRPNAGIWMDAELSSPAARMSVTQWVPRSYSLPLSRCSGVCEKTRSSFRCKWRAHQRPHGKLRRNHRSDKAGRSIRHGASEFYQQCICRRQAPISRCMVADVQAGAHDGGAASKGKQKPGVKIKLPRRVATAIRNLSACCSRGG